MTIHQRAVVAAIIAGFLVIIGFAGYVFALAIYGPVVLAVTAVVIGGGMLLLIPVGIAGMVYERFVGRDDA